MKFVLLMFIMSAYALASYPVIKVNDLNGSYSEKIGSAYAGYAFYELDEVVISHQDITVNFNMFQKNLVFRDDKNSVQLKFDFDFLNVFKTIEFYDLEVKSKGRNFKADLSKLSVKLGEDQYNLSELALLSDLTNRTDINTEFDILEGFIYGGQVKAKTLDFAQSSGSFVKQINNKFPELKKLNLKGIPFIARFIDVSIQDGEIFAIAKMDSYINLWFRLWATMEYLQERKELVINISKAKLGYFGITRIVLNEIRDIASTNENIRIDGSKIIINLESVMIGKTPKSKKNK